ncbi:TonB-dependent siderophore receptor [Nostoc sp. LPT]|uniref:TonB-dependent siderophore receptor n=1 Tax=Nostoc sp. LPT TaxID=2815387 RepID=UPI001D442B41|nr:TonB-dependent siderophore receptor [Nostoc sp. LPT]MBN4006073.1 TonB-dependent siderophore receptor [Nostoc sp. LPT]
MGIGKQLSVLIAGVISAIAMQPVWANDSQEIAENYQLRPTEQNLQVKTLISEIKQVSEIDLPLTNAEKLVQSPTPASEIVQVTEVKANPTSKGVEVILQTTLGEQLQVTNRSAGNSFIVDIPNAQLRLPSGEAFTFRSDKPIAGVTQITVTNFDANTIRVTVIGEASVPTVELYDSQKEGLIFSVASAASSTQQGQQPQTQQIPQSSKPTSETQPSQPSAQGDEPIELVVTGEQDGYRVPDASTATKTDTPLRDIPQSIQVVPQQVLRDQQANNIDEVLRNVPGTSQSFSSRASFQPGVIIRGFSTNNYLRNGVQDPTAASLGFDPAITERVEVLKGPSSVLYGQGNPGGTINLVTKQPLSNPYYSIEGSIGNFDFYRGALDLSGPLNTNRTLLYRLNAAAQTSGSFVDFFESRQRYAVAPTLTWLVSDQTKLTLSGEYLDTITPYDSGLPAIGTLLSNPNGKIPRNRFVGDTADDNNFRAYRISYDFEHRFSDKWLLRTAFQASFLNLDRVYFLGTGFSDNRNLSRLYVQSDYDDKAYNLDTYTVGKFATGTIQHQMVTGINLSRRDIDSKDLASATTSLDLFNPVYGQPLGLRTNVLPPQRKFRADTLGIYVQDQITLAENLKLLLGGRFDIASQKGEALLVSLQSKTAFEQDEAFSPRVGIVYQPIPPISLYASYSRSFLQPGTIFNNGTLFKPERGTQYEVGIKADLSDRLSTTLAFYDLTRTNVLTTDPRNSLLSIETGKQRSQGIELDLSGQILPGWNMIAGYAYTDARVEEDTTYPGKLLNNVPKHSFNFWTTYEIQSGSLQGLGLGLGFFFTGDRQGDLANTFELPSYFRTDAAIFYKREAFRVALNFRNLFDVDYFDSAISRVRVFYGDPLTVQGTISWEF